MVPLVPLVLFSSNRQVAPRTDPVLTIAWQPNVLIDGEIHYQVHYHHASRNLTTCNLQAVAIANYGLIMKCVSVDIPIDICGESFPLHRYCRSTDAVRMCCMFSA